MDYLGWELERQRSALRALLGGGGTEEDEALRPSPRDGSAPGAAARRSPAYPEAARGDAALGEAGRYAGEREEAGGPLPGAPGARTAPRETESSPRGRGGLQTQAGRRAERPEEEAGPAVQRAWDGAAETPALSRRRILEDGRDLSRTDGAAEPSSGGGEAGAETLETAAGTRARAAESGAKTKTAAGAAGGGRAGGDLAAGGLAAGEAEGGGWLALPRGTGMESAALRAEDGAKALSRAVQRDARRYDGGFTLY